MFYKIPGYFLAFNRRNIKSYLELKSDRSFHGYRNTRLKCVVLWTSIGASSKENTKEVFVLFRVLKLIKPIYRCVVTSSGGSLHSAGLRNNTGLEFIF